MNMHELKVTTSTIHKDQSTVIMSFKHLHTRTRRERAKRQLTRERAKRAHSLYHIATFTIIQYVVMGDLSFPEYRFTIIQYVVMGDLSFPEYRFTIIHYVVMGDLSFPEYRFTYHFR